MSFNSRISVPKEFYQVHRSLTISHCTYSILSFPEQDRNKTLQHLNLIHSVKKCRWHLSSAFWYALMSFHSVKRSSQLFLPKKHHCVRIDLFLINTLVHNFSISWQLHLSKRNCFQILLPFTSYNNSSNYFLPIF